jgi:hypothetical protein
MFVGYALGMCRKVGAGFAATFLAIRGQIRFLDREVVSLFVATLPLKTEGDILANTVMDSSQKFLSSDGAFSTALR